MVQTVTSLVFSSRRTEKKIPSLLHCFEQKTKIKTKNYEEISGPAIRFYCLGKKGRGRAAEKIYIFGYFFLLAFLVFLLSDQSERPSFRENKNKKGRKIFFPVRTPIFSPFVLFAAFSTYVGTTALFKLKFKERKKQNSFGKTKKE